ncbi:TlpA family protein disulfide reductase [Brevibacterium yomogidense]|uniref:TlpA family protein disulfide reductase n=1 Tax=Brevibacterium yomogidense TaxID=946573 RepID=UPI0018E045EF|nr:MauE/DoxX family redox-associated membrane protein [Brevibacterium yomogidense]
MAPLLTGILILLSLVLLLSGGSKLPDHRGTVDAMTSLRIPLTILHKPLAHILPVGELALAVSLWLPSRTSSLIGAVLTTGVFAVFTVIIGRALRFDEPITCACFGSFGAPTVTPLTLARNIVLTVLGGIGIAGAAAGAGPGRLWAASGAVVVSAGLLVVATAAVTWLVVGGTGALSGGADRAPAAGGAEAEADTADAVDSFLAAPIPFAQLRGADGDLVSLRRLVRTEAHLLLFLSPGCGPCVRTLERLSEFRARLAPVVRVDAVFRRPVEELSGTVRAQVGPDVWEDPETNVGEAFQIAGRPAAVLLGADGTIAGGPVTGEDDVADLVDEMVEQLSESGLLETGAGRVSSEADAPGA